MADEEHWAQRRQRASRCKIHGLHYDPRLTSGCSLCRKEGLAAQPRQKPQMVLMLLALLGVAVGLYRIFGPSSDVSADIGALAPAPEPAAVAASRLDPEPYRASITAVEAALFRSSAPSLPEMSAQIVNALSRLRGDLDLRQEGEAAVAALDELGARVAEEALTLDALARLHLDWERLRGRTFLAAPWFVVPSRAVASTGRAALMTYRAAADDLGALLDEGASRAQELTASPTPNFLDPKVREGNAEAWRGYRSDWRRRIVELRRQLPARPTADADPRTLLATQRLEQAFAQVSALAAGELPAGERVDAAFEAVEQARRSFDELLAP